MALLRTCLFAMGLLALAPVAGLAQCIPTTLSVSPGSVMQTQPYTMTTNCWNVTLDVMYRFNDGGEIEILGWPYHGFYGQATIWTDMLTVPGKYQFTRIRNTDMGPDSDYYNVSAVIYVTAYVAPPQPTSLTVSPASVTAGAGSYLMTAGNGANMTVDVQYNLNGAATQTILGWPSLNGNGQASIYTGSCTVPGTYTYTGIRNTNVAQWITQGISAPIGVTAPGAPAASGMTPGGVVRGNAVNITIPGSNLCGATLSTTWPGITFTNVSTWTDVAITATVITTASSPIGLAPVAVTARGATATVYFAVAGNQPPTITAATPASAKAGTSSIVNFAGTNLIGATLSSNWGGLTISGSQSNSNGTAVTALLTLSANAAIGNPPIVVTTPAGSVTTQAFTVTALPSLSKEHIYFGDRAVAIVSAPPPAAISAPSSLSAQYSSATAVNLSWAAATGGNGGVAGYRVYREGVLISGSVLIAGTTFSDTTAVANAAYTYHVTAVDGAGQSSAASATRSVFRDNFNRPDTWSGFSNPAWGEWSAWMLQGGEARQEYSGTPSWRDALTVKSFASFKATYDLTAFGYGPCTGLVFWDNGTGRYRLCVYAGDLNLSYYGPGGGTLAQVFGGGGGNTYRIEANASTRNIRVYVDNVLKINVTDSNTARSNLGRVGICNATPEGGPPVSIDNFVVEEQP